MTRSVVVLAVALVAGACASRGVSPQASADAYTLDDDGLPVISEDPSAPLPVDPSVRVGTLPNGLTYYVEHNPRPADSAELRLVVRAGSVLEDDDQLGVAHFVEHMAFNGTEHFPGQSIIDVLEAAGTRFGAHINATTSFDETIYKLAVPTDDEAVFDDALTIMRDWTDGITFDAEECERERGVVMEEWRLGEGLQARAREATMGVLLHGSRYLERLPIGSADSLETFDCDAAVRFWETWYRPELMAVMVVGDVDPEAVDAKIRARFGDLPAAPPEAPDRPVYTVPDHDEVLVEVFTDPEIRQSQWSRVDKVDDVETGTHASYRTFLIENMVWTMINERFGILAQDPTQPLLGAIAYQDALGIRRGAQSLQGASREGQELEALEVMLVELERARRYGFTPDELDRARKSQQRVVQAYHDERETTDSATHIAEIERVFLTDEPMPGIPYEYAMARAMLPDITVDEVNAWVDTHLFPGDSVGFMLLAPDKPGLDHPTPDAIRALAEDVARRPIAAPAAGYVDVEVMSEPPTPGEIVDVSVDEAHGVETWTLSNGATVKVKATDFQQDVIRFGAISQGGASGYTGDDYIPAATAMPIMLRSGLAHMDAVTLSKALAGHVANVQPFLSERTEGVDGVTTRSDLELALQLTHLAFTAPRFDEQALVLHRRSFEETLRNRDVSPEAWFDDAWSEMMWDDHPRYAPWREDDLARFDLAASERVYRERFGNAADFTFVFTGSFDREALYTLVERYLASLPGEPSAPETASDLGIERVPGVVERTISSGDTPRSSVRLAFHGPYREGLLARLELDGVAQALGTRLREILREELGGTYGVSVDERVIAGDEPEYVLEIGFACDPERTDTLVAAMWVVIEEIRTTAAGDSFVEALRAQKRRDRAEDRATNGFWLSALLRSAEPGVTLDEILDLEARLEAVDAERIRQVAAEVLDDDTYKLLIQRPGGPAPEE